MNVYRTQGFMRFAPAGVGQAAAPPASPSSAPTGERGSPPSSYAVLAVLEGQDGAIMRLIGLTLLRGAFVIPGIWVAAKLARVDMEPWQLITMGFAGSATISAGMLGYYAIQRRLNA